MEPDARAAGEKRRGRGVLSDSEKPRRHGVLSDSEKPWPHERRKKRPREPLFEKRGGLFVIFGHRVQEGVNALCENGAFAFDVEVSVDELDDGGGEGFGDVTGLNEDGDVIGEIFLNERGRGRATFFFAIGAGDEEGSVEIFEEFKDPGLAGDADAQFAADFRERFYDLSGQVFFVWVEPDGEFARPQGLREELCLWRDVGGDLFEHGVVGDEDE